MVGYTPEPINGRELSTTEYSEAGLISGIATRALVQPLDVLKIRLQLQKEPLRGHQSGKYRGLLHAIRLIATEEGVGAFWKGHVPAQGLSAIYGLVQFSTFEWLTKKASIATFGVHSHVDHQQKQQQQTAIDFACGALAGCTAMTAALPLDVIRTRLVAQGEPKVYKGTIDAARFMYRHEGMRGFFRGLTPSLIQVAPFTGLQFTLYRWLNDMWTNLGIEHDATGSLACGALAGTCSKVVLYPLDMVRHRVQIVDFEQGRRGFGSHHEQRGMVRSFLSIIKHEGAIGLFKGLLPSLIKTAFNSGFSFLFYQLSCDLLRKR